MSSPSKSPVDLDESARDPLNLDRQDEETTARAEGGELDYAESDQIGGEESFDQPMAESTMIGLEAAAVAAAGAVTTGTEASGGAQEDESLLEEEDDDDDDDGPSKVEEVTLSDDEEEEDQEDEEEEEEEEDVPDQDEETMEEDEDDEEDSTAHQDISGDEESNSERQSKRSGRGDKSAAMPVISIPILKLKRHRPDSGTASPAASSPASSTDQPTPRRRPGRPSKAEMERRERERQDRIARGEPEPPKPRRRAPRKTKEPVDPEEKARLKEEKRKAKLAERAAKMRERRRLKKLSDEKEGIVRKRGRRAKVLTDEEKQAREEARRLKYEELKRAKLEKAAKRQERNQYLRELRKKKKEEEKRQREAYDKRMQELKANFLDENSHLSGAADDSVTATTAALDESSQMSTSSKSKGGLGTFEMQQLRPIKQVSAETLFEYRWPLDTRNSEYYFLQEQVCEYLGLKSFKRRYPDLQRRNVDVEERDFLVEMRVVNETQADLGLTALPSAQVLDIMSNDFYEKYDAYMSVVAERKDKTIRQTNYTTASVEKHKYADFVERAVRSTAEWNKNMNQERREKRQAYFDMQTFNIHYPMNNRGRMRVMQTPGLGYYPVALIPGQFVDYYKSYNPEQLRYLPLNSALVGPPKSNIRLEDIRPALPSPPPQQTLHSGGESDEDDSSDSSSSSSGSSGSSSGGDGSSSSSESDSDEEGSAPETTEDKVKKGEDGRTKKGQKRPIDAEVPGARCKNCLGDRQRNKIGQPEKLMHCSKCELSAHPTCIGLVLELLEYATGYDWECTECKVCSRCKDHSDEDKMLFCDLCDRGYHNYCVGLDTIPSGSWHCVECTYCASCKMKDSLDSIQSKTKWVVEYKTGLSGNKIYSHTMCSLCHKSWKRGQFCPECNVVFGREDCAPQLKKKSFTSDDDMYANCWVCSRQHHLSCVGQATFICAACQRRTQERCVGAAQRLAASKDSSTDQPAPSTPQQSATMHSFVQAPPPTSPQAEKPRRLSMETGPVTCELCHKVYKNKSTLYSHKNRDHGYKASQQAKHLT